MRYPPLRLWFATGLFALLGGCTGYVPPPMASINCEQQDEVGAGDWAYLQCVRELSRNMAQPTAAPARP